MYWIIIAIKIISIVNCETRYISTSLDCYTTPIYFGTTVSFADRLYYSKTADPIIYDDEDNILTVDYNTDDLTTIGKPACTIYYAHNNTHSVTWQGPVSLRQLPVECTLLDKEYCFENKNPLSNIKGGMMCCCKDDLCNYGSSSFFIFFGRLASPRKIDNTMKELSPLLKGAALSTIIVLVSTFFSCIEYIVRRFLIKDNSNEILFDDIDTVNEGANFRSKASVKEADKDSVSEVTVVLDSNASRFKLHAKNTKSEDKITANMKTMEEDKKPAVTQNTNNSSKKSKRAKKTVESAQILFQKKPKPTSSLNFKSQRNVKTKTEVTKTENQTSQVQSIIPGLEVMAKLNTDTATTTKSLTQTKKTSEHE